MCNRVYIHHTPLILHVFLELIISFKSCFTFFTDYHLYAMTTIKLWDNVFFIHAVVATGALAPRS